MGGRGSTVKIENGNGGDNENRRSGGKIISDFVSRINNMYDRNKMSFTHMLDNFRDKFVGSRVEHLIATDDDGFAYVLNHGRRHSVSYDPDTVKGRFVIHNHPSDSVFSRTDLKNVVLDSMKGVVASGKSGDYIFKTTKRFNGNEFLKALKKSPIRDTFTLKAGESREEGYRRISKEADKWLRGNASTYGYEYQYRKAKK